MVDDRRVLTVRCVRKLESNEASAAMIDVVSLRHPKGIAVVRSMGSCIPLPYFLLLVLCVVLCYVMEYGLLLLECNYVQIIVGGECLHSTVVSDLVLDC